MFPHMGPLYIHGPGPENQRVQVHEPTAQEHGRGYISSPDIADAQYVRKNLEIRRQLRIIFFNMTRRHNKTGQIFCPKLLRRGGRLEPRASRVERTLLLTRP